MCMAQICDTTSLSTCAANDATKERRRLSHAVVLVMCTGVMALSILLKPDGQELSLLGHRWPWRCWLRDTFGLECALCGLSRSFCSLARADITAALAFHRLGPLVFALFCLEVPYRICAVAISPRRISQRLARAHFALAALAVAAVFVNWLLYVGELAA